MSKSKDQVIIFDTTLRDGEQSPGATMTFDEKLQVADLLDEMLVDVIEAGFPIASDGDFEAVSEIARRTKHSVIAGLARAIPGDIKRCIRTERYTFIRNLDGHFVISRTKDLHLRDFIHPPDFVPNFFSPLLEATLRHIS